MCYTGCGARYGSQRFASLADFIWKSAEDLWGGFKHTHFGKVILPSTRRPLAHALRLVRVADRLRDWLQRATSSEQGSLKASAEALATLKTYYKEVDRWPERWADFPNLDVPVGERIVAEMKSFLLTLISERRTKKTVRNYAN